MAFVFPFAKSAIAEAVGLTLRILVEDKWCDVVQWPSHEEADEISAGFRATAPIPGAMLLLDCTHFPVRPKRAEMHGYLNKKGWHSINVQFMVSLRLRIWAYTNTRQHGPLTLLVLFPADRRQHEVPRRCHRLWWCLRRRTPLPVHGPYPTPTARGASPEHPERQVHHRRWPTQTLFVPTATHRNRGASWYSVLMGGLGRWPHLTAVPCDARRARVMKCLTTR